MSDNERTCTLMLEMRYSTGTRYLEQDIDLEYKSSNGADIIMNNKLRATVQPFKHQQQYE